MSSDVAVRAGSALAVDPGQSFWTEEQRAALRQIGVDEATNGDLAVFLNYAQRTQLDPFSRQIYMIGRNEKQQDGSWRKKWTIQASIDGLRIIAQRSGDYAGQVGPEWCGQDGVWHDVWLAPEPPAAARVGVIRTGFAQPLYAVAMFREYVGTDKQGNPTRMWQEKGALMLAKCAEALALRKAFPNDMSGIYTSEEMSRADAPLPVPPGVNVVTGEVVEAEVIVETGPWQSAVDAASTLDELRLMWDRYAPDMTSSGRAALHHAMTVRKEELDAATPEGDTEADAGAEEGEADAPASDDHSGPATRTDLKNLTIALTNAGVSGRQDILDWISERIGRAIASRNELTHAEAIHATQAAGRALADEAVPA